VLGIGFCGRKKYGRAPKLLLQTIESAAYPTWVLARSIDSSMTRYQAFESSNLRY
jgi:hypothetical protein